jgi:hypothetical protein
MQQQEEQCQVCLKLRHKRHELGDVVSIHHAGNFEGDAILMKRLDDHEVPYIRSRCLGCGELISFIKKRYRVKFLTGPNEGWVTARKVPEIYGTGVAPVKTRFDEEE